MEVFKLLCVHGYCRYVYVCKFNAISREFNCEICKSLRRLKIGLEYINQMGIIERRQGGVCHGEHNGQYSHEVDDIVLRFTFKGFEILDGHFSCIVGVRILSKVRKRNVQENDVCERVLNSTYSLDTVLMWGTLKVFSYKAFTPVFDAEGIQMVKFVNDYINLTKEMENDKIFHIKNVIRVMHDSGFRVLPCEDEDFDVFDSNEYILDSSQVKVDSTVYDSALEPNA